MSTPSVPELVAQVSALTNEKAALDAKVAEQAKQISDLELQAVAALEKQDADKAALESEQNKVAVLETEKQALNGEIQSLKSANEKLLADQKTAEQRAVEIAASMGAKPLEKGKQSDPGSSEQKDFSHLTGLQRAIALHQSGSGKN